jgi:hypothetical protein
LKKSTTAAAVITPVCAHAVYQPLSSEFSYASKNVQYKNIPMVFSYFQSAFAQHSRADFVIFAALFISN